MYLPDMLLNVGKVYYGIGESFLTFLRHTTYISELTFKTFIRMYLLFKNVKLTIHQMFIIGVESLPLVTVTSIFIGGETVVLAKFIFSNLLPMHYFGYAVSKTLVTELCPVLTSFVVASRISTAIAAEIGSMKITEQLDAMTCLSLDTVRYLIVPKVVAGIIMLPVLVIFSELIAFSGSIVTVIVFVKNLTLYQYLSGIKLFFSVPHMLIGIAKTSVFGAIITLTGAHFGLQSMRGAQGIGEATTRAVMTAMVLILFFDFLMAFLTLN